MAVLKWDPFKDIITLRDRMDRLFEESLSRLKEAGDESTNCSWTPAVDLYETLDNMVIQVEIPGVEKEDISVEVRDGSLHLKGERKFEENCDEGNYQRMERSYGTFYRIFTLPTSVDQDSVKASFKNGVLEITIPKSESSRPEQINVAIE